MKKHILLIIATSFFCHTWGQRSSTYQHDSLIGYYQGHIINGELEGYGIKYSFDKSRSFEGYFVNGHLTGKFNEFDSLGTLIREGEYFMDSKILEMNRERKVDYEKKLKQLNTVLIRGEIDSFMYFQIYNSRYLI